MRRWTVGDAILALGLLTGCGGGKTTEGEDAPPEVKTEIRPDGTIVMTPVDPNEGKQPQPPPQKPPGAKK